MTTAAIVALILQGGPVALDFFIKIRTLLSLSPDEHMNIVNAVAASNAADDATISAANAWLVANKKRNI